MQYLETAMDIIGQFVEDVELCKQIVDALDEAKMFRPLVTTSSKQMTEAEAIIRKLVAEGKDTGEISRLVGLSFQATRYYILKIHNVRGLKDLSKK